MAYFWKDGHLSEKKAQLPLSLSVQDVCGQDVWFATQAVRCLPRPGRRGDLIIQGVLRAKKGLFEIEIVHEEQIESDHGEEREEGQTRTEASQGAARVQAEPENKPARDEKIKPHRKSADVQRFVINTHRLAHQPC